MASYDIDMLKVVELFSKAIVPVVLRRLHDCMLNFVHLSATGMAKIAKSSHLMGCPPVAVSAVKDEGALYFFHEHGLISITAYWMTVIHILFTQFNVTAIGLGYYMIIKFSQYPS